MTESNAFGDLNGKFQVMVGVTAPCLPDLHRMQKQHTVVRKPKYKEYYHNHQKFVGT